MSARRQPEQKSIPTPNQTMIGRIGHQFLEVAPEGTYFFGRPL